MCGVAGVTNPTGVPYQDGFIGAQAKFAEINKRGGLFGRDLKLVGKYDDQTRDSKNISAVRRRPKWKFSTSRGWRLYVTTGLPATSIVSTRPKTARRLSNAIAFISFSVLPASRSARLPPHHATRIGVRTGSDVQNVGNAALGAKKNAAPR